MRQTVYKCDGCKRELGLKRHISLQLTGASGVAIPPNDPFFNASSWLMDRSLRGEFLHFHNGDCAKKYFDKILDYGKQK